VVRSLAAATVGGVEAGSTRLFILDTADVNPLGTGGCGVLTLSAVKSYVSVPNSSPLNWISSAPMASSGISTADWGIFDVCGSLGFCVLGLCCEERLEDCELRGTPTLFIDADTWLLLMLLVMLLATPLWRPALEKIADCSCALADPTVE